MKKLFTLLFAGACLGASAQNFTAGNLVVFRSGDGVAALSNASAAIFLDEYTPAGVLVQSVAMPTTASGSNNIITTSGTATSEGLITKSTNGQYLIITGYNTAPGLASVAGTATTTVTRVVATIDATKNVNSSTSFADAFSAGNIRGAASTNGTEFWVTGSVSGIRYTTLGTNSTAGSPSVQVAAAPTNVRNVSIFNGQLYISSGSGTARLATVGTGTPVTASQTVTALPGFPAANSPYQFFFADLDASVAGVDVVYVAEDGNAAGTSGLLKYSLVAGNWVSNGNILPTGGGLRGLTASVSGTTVTMYATTGAALYSFTDASGYNASLTGSLTSIATAPANTAFRGVASAPSLLPMPICMGACNLSVVSNNVSIKWNTVSELNVKTFSVERSANGTSFTAIDAVTAKNIASGANYSFTDAAPLAGVSYYRLKVIDKDGSFKYTPVMVANTKKGLGIKVLGNPVSANLVINHDAAAKGTVIKVYNSIGALVKTINVTESATQTSSNVSQLVKGSYLAVFEANGQKQSLQFIKQ